MLTVADLGGAARGGKRRNAPLTLIGKGLVVL